MNPTPKPPTPETDAAEKAYKAFNLKVYDLDTWNIETLAALGTPPPDGWKFARTLEQKLNEALAKVKELEQRNESLSDKFEQVCAALETCVLGGSIGRRWSKPRNW